MDLTDVKAIQFPGGERHVTLPDDAASDRTCSDDVLHAVIRSSSDLMDLLLVTDALESQRRKPKRLYLPYIPYARQDRVTSKGTAFSMRVAARLINELHYEEVHVYEPHSEVAAALLKNCVVHLQDQEVKQFAHDLQRMHHKENVLVLAPDAGASKRVERLGFTEMGQALKHRDPATGRLEISFVTENVIGRDVLIVDDICDGGATFIQLAKRLFEMKVKSVSLFVAHGIFSKGLEVLTNAGISHVGTTSSFYAGNDPGLSVYPLPTIV